MSMGVSISDREIVTYHSSSSCGETRLRIAPDRVPPRLLQAERPIAGYPRLLTVQSLRLSFDPSDTFVFFLLDIEGRISRGRG